MEVYYIFELIKSIKKMNNNNTYKLVGSKFLLGMIILFDALLIFGIIMFLKEDPIIQQQLKGVIYSMSTFLAIATIYAINNVSKKVTIIDNSIAYTSLFKNKKIALNNINQFKIRSTYIDLIAKEGKGFKTFKNPHLAKWLEQNFADFNAIAYQKEVDEILQNDRYGATKEERETNLNKADYFSNAVTISIGIYMILIFIFPIPIKWTMAVVIIATLCIVLGVIYYRGKLRIEWNTIYPSMAVASFITLLLFSFSLMNYESYNDITRFFKIGFILSGLFSLYYIFIIVGVKALKFLSVWLPLLLLTGLITGSIYILNVVLDTSEPQLYTTQIADKEVKYGKYRTYEIDLASWDNLKKPGLNIDVSKRTFKKIKVGETVQIKHYKGRFGKQWYNVYKDGKLLTQNESLIGWLFNL